MNTFVVAFISVWLSAIVLTRFTPTRFLRNLIAIALCLAFCGVAAIAAPHTVAWQRLALTSAGLLYLIKFVILLVKYDPKKLASFSQVGLLIYSTIWPGMNPAPFKKRETVEESGRRFVNGFLCMCAGAALLITLSIGISAVNATLVGYIGLVALLLLIHFGYAEVLTSSLRMLGWNVAPLFDSPLKSTSLRGFWSLRWNYAFVEMNKILFLPLLKRFCSAPIAIFGIFVVSGILHDLAISYPVLNPWGLPTIYFLLQGIGFFLERTYMRNVRSIIVRRIWTWCWLLCPVGLLFTDTFRTGLILPAVQQLHSIICQHDISWWLGLGLWFAAGGNFVTMCAGIQVPWRLNWKEELLRLSPFNRKIFLNYYGYIGMCIFAWGTSTFVLHDELLAGDKAALLLAFLMGTFWGVRVIVDFFFFDHNDWAKGPELVVGHTLLTALFCALSATYYGVVLWHFIM